MKNPLYEQAKQNDYQLEFEIEEIKADLKKLNWRLDIAKQYGSLRNYENEQFRQLVADCVALLHS